MITTTTPDASYPGRYEVAAQDGTPLGYVQRTSAGWALMDAEFGILGADVGTLEDAAGTLARRVEGVR